LEGTPRVEMHPKESSANSASSAFNRRVVDLAHLPQDDPAVYRLLCAADTIGIFQVESRAQMATLPRLKPARFYDLVVQVAIIRPGPIVGQMVHPYLNRRAGREPVTYPHPTLEPILARTLGVPLFQEQLLRIAMVAAGFTGGQAEELRRAFGFKRSERRMKEVEVQLREGMTRQGITGAAAEQIITSITSFALYGFPESHAASFALLAYASAYLKVHYPAAFYTALLNNQPMGFYHPSTLVKDAQRRGVRFQPIDAQISDWDCTVERDGAIRLGLRYVSGLREQVGRAISRVGAADLPGSAPHPAQRRAEPHPAERRAAPHPSERRADLIRSADQICPKCGCDDPSMLERSEARSHTPETWFCNNCSHDWQPAQHRPRRFASLDELVSRTGLRRDELVTLADIGALNSFGYDRRSALWQAERAVRPSGELFVDTSTTESTTEHTEITEHMDPFGDPQIGGPDKVRPTTEDKVRRSNEDLPGNGFSAGSAVSALNVVFDGGPDQIRPPNDDLFENELSVGSVGSVVEDAANEDCPLKPMTEAERLVADYAGTGLTMGRHPMALKRETLAMQGVMRAIDLYTARASRRVRVAGMVITRQRPGTAKGFVFLTLEDETGIANIIIRPDLFARERQVIIEEPFLLIDGVLQNQDGVTSVRAEAVQGMRGVSVDFDAHDFY
jgi:DNA polymerase III alpha subunit